VIDLVNGDYGEITGKINKELKDLVNFNSSSKDKKTSLTAKEYRGEFKKKCIEKNLGNLYRNDKHLLNYILFPDISIDFYLEVIREKDERIYDLQESLGVHIND